MLELLAATWSQSAASLLLIPMPSALQVGVNMKAKKLQGCGHGYSCSKLMQHTSCSFLFQHCDLPSLEPQFDAENCKNSFRTKTLTHDADVHHIITPYLGMQKKKTKLITPG